MILTRLLAITTLLYIRIRMAIATESLKRIRIRAIIRAILYLINLTSRYLLRASSIIKIL